METGQLNHSFQKMIHNERNLHDILYYIYIQCIVKVKRTKTKRQRNYQGSTDLHTKFICPGKLSQWRWKAEQ